MPVRIEDESAPPVVHDRRGARTATWLTAAFALAMFGAHAVTIFVTPYSFHRDELLYIAMGRYLHLFAMDFPPFIALAANALRALFGDTLFAIRILPAVAGAALIALTAAITRELGGGRSEQALAMLCVLLAPLFMRAAALFQPVIFDQLWWTLALYAVIRIANRGLPRDWLLLGGAGGIGLLTKFSIGFIAVGVLAGLLLSPQRRAFATRWPYVAGALALLIGSPSILGQLQLGIPVAGQMSDLQAEQLSVVTPTAFLAGQLLMIGPAALLALLGAVALMGGTRLRQNRAAGIACVIAFLLLLVLRGKPYYAGPVYPTLLAAGAVVLRDFGRTGRVVQRSVAVLTALYGIITLPLGLPLLPPEPMARYAERLGATAATTTNRGTVLPLPQDYADMLGWEEQVDAVAAAYHALPDAERARAVIIAANYGEAGAVDFLGPSRGLPRAVAPTGSYWFFGPGELPGDIAVTIGIEPEDIAGFYAEFQVVRRVENRWGVPEQQDNPIGVARRPYRTLQEVWPELAGRN